MTLDEEYQKTIDDQRTHLFKLQENFNKKCDEFKVKAEEKLKAIPSENKEAKEAVLKAQKTEIENALTDLKNEVDRSTRETMRKLEEIVRRKEAQILSRLEQQIANL